MTLEASIRLHAQNTLSRPAIICGSDTMTYGELWEAIERRGRELEAADLKACRAYVFENPQNADFIVTYCAIHNIGAVAVPLEKDVPREKFQAIVAELENCSFGPEIKDILYTTGTTGKSKGVMLSSTCLEACADNFISDLHFSSELCFIICGPLNHIASLFKIHPVLTAGGCIYVLDGLKDLNAFYDVFNLPFSKFATFLVPASIRMLMQFSYDKLRSLADRIDFIETGAAPITHADMKMLAEALPKSRLYNTLGGTEIGCVSTYDFNDGKYMEGCIGRPLKNCTLDILEDGSIVVSGRTIMSGYVNDPELTAQVMKDGRIYGSDLGYYDEDGLIHLKGRRGDIINVGGFKVNPVDVENAALSFKGISDCICVAAKHPVIGTVPKLLYVAENGVELDKKMLIAHLRQSLEAHKIPVYFEAVDKIQRTFNGKLDRKWYRNEK